MNILKMEIVYKSIDDTESYFMLKHHEDRGH